jgi:hypothetical protein
MPDDYEYEPSHEVLSRAGYDPRFTPLDTLMAAPVGVGLAVADAMENEY